VATEHNVEIMPAPVKKILDNYASENAGVRANLYRLLMTGRLAGTGKLVILPVDQGFEHGPARSFAVNPAGYDPEYHAKLAVAAGCNSPQEGPEQRAPIRPAQEAARWQT